MPYLNSVQLMGHLGKDAEVRSTPAGKRVATFNVATTEKWKDAGGSPQERTTWHRCVKWEPPDWMTAGLVKGSLVYVEGRLSTREWEKDGQKKSTTEIVASEILLLAARERTTSSQPAAKDEDIPF